MNVDLMLNTESEDTVPFGKYKGQPVEVLLADKRYLDWVMNQASLVSMYSRFFESITIVDPSSTPEHNKMQIKYLEADYRRKLVEIVTGSKFNIRASVNFEPIDVSFDCVGMSFFIELKPLVGDDYPEILRKMKIIHHDSLIKGARDRNGNTYGDFVILVIRDYNGISISLGQLIAFFKSQGIRVVMECDVDGVS